MRGGLGGRKTCQHLPLIAEWLVHRKKAAVTEGGFRSDDGCNAFKKKEKEAKEAQLGGGADRHNSLLTGLMMRKTRKKRTKKRHSKEICNFGVVLLCEISSRTNKHGILW